MNRKKRWEIVICLILIWTAMILQAYSLYRWDQEEKILETFDILDSVPVEGCIEMSASINKLYLNQKEKQHVLEDLADELGLGKDYEICQENRENTERTILKKEGDIGSVHLSITTIEADMGDGNRCQEQYLYLLYRSKKKMDMMLAYKEKIEKVMKDWNLSIYSNLTLEGERTGRLSLTEQEELTDRLFHYLEAKEVEAVKKKDLYTVYGYSDLLKDSVAYGDNEINLNLVFTYDEEQDCTVFYLAMPYLRTDY